MWWNYGWWCGCSVDLWCIHHLSTSRPMKPKAPFRCPSVCRFPVACCAVNVDILDRCWLCSHARTSHWFYPVLMNMLSFECWHSRVLTLVLLPSHSHCMSWMWRLWGSWGLYGGGLWIYYFSTAQIVDDEDGFVDSTHHHSHILNGVAEVWRVQWIWAATWQNQHNECAPSEDSDQPGHPPSLIRVFAVRLMGS